MAGSEEAFARFDSWKNLRTFLKVTLLTNGEKPEILIGQIVAADEEANLLGFAVRGKRSLRRIDLDGASFQVGKCVLGAERSNGTEPRSPSSKFLSWDFTVR